MSYEANPNFGFTTTPDLGSSVLTPSIDIATPVTTTGSRVPKIIVIVILVILIIVAIILIFVFRNNINVCENNENPACPILACPVGQFGVVADPDCGASAFRFEGTKKICSNTRYA